MKVSIITCCYNRAHTIQSAIDSVLAQDYKDIEYIVVDGASADGSVEIIKKMMDDSRWKSSWKFISEPDHGMYEAINKGVRMATGDIIGLVHSDDFLYDSHVISDVVRKFEETGADFVYGDGIFVNFHKMMIGLILTDISMILGILIFLHYLIFVQHLQILFLYVFFYFLNSLFFKK